MMGVEVNLVTNTGISTQSLWGVLLTLIIGTIVIMTLKIGNIY